MWAKTSFMAAVVVFGSALALAQTTGSSSTGQSATAPDPSTLPENSAGYTQSDSGSTNQALQSRIEYALHNEPTLGSSHVAVRVSDNAIDLSGTVGSSKDKQTAERIAESFDGNRQMNNKLVVTGRGHSDLAPGHPAMNNGGTGDVPNPATSPGANNSNNNPPQN